VPTGGTAGQYLRKVSGTDYDVAFADVPASEVSVTPSGLFVVSGTNVQEAIRQIDLELSEKADVGHLHDERYWGAGNFANGTFQCPASTGNFSVSGVGFRPGRVEFTMSLASTDYIASGQGVMDANSVGWAMSQIYRRSTALGTSDVVLAATGGVCIQMRNEAGSANYVRATFVSMDANGFTVNFSAVNTGFFIGWRAYR
jgi:hypothetical protein